MKRVATHVRINGKVYILGQTSRSDRQIQCIREGRVERVCTWRPGGYKVGERIYTSGEYHDFLGAEK